MASSRQLAELNVQTARARMPFTLGASKYGRMRGVIYDGSSFPEGFKDARYSPVSVAKAKKARWWEAMPRE